MDLIHHETLPVAPFTTIQLFMSERYLVTVWTRKVIINVSIDKYFYETIFEVRSTTDFSVVYSTVKEKFCEMSCFRFINDTLAVRIVTPFEPSAKIR